MSPLAHLLLAACALHAASPATISDLDHTNAAQELVKPVDIPVEVVVEDAKPSIKANEINNEEEIKRPAIDLRNPGPPQRQEHETQNPEPYTAVQQQVSNVRDGILQTHALLRQGLQGVSDDIQNWLANNQQINVIQQNIQSLRQTFADQIHKLNTTVQSIAVPNSKPEEFEQVKAHLNLLEKNFNNGVRALSDGVNVVAYLRAESANAQLRAEGENTATAPPNNLFSQVSSIIQVFQDRFNSGLSNITQAFNNTLYNFGIQNPPTDTGSAEAGSGALADSPGGSTTTQRNPWPQLPALPSLPNIPNLFQGYQEFFQNLLPGRPGATTSKPGEASAGSNVVPEKPNDVQLAAVVPAPAPAPEAASPPETVGPIRQILNNNPVVQGIAGAVQRIQGSINNPEKPREPEKNNDVQTKGGFYAKPPYGGVSGDNSLGGLKQQNEDIVKEDIIPEDTKKEAEDINKPEPEKKTE